MTTPPTGAHITYMQQYRKCGKPHCNTCRNGPGHGKYWYGYYRNPGSKKLHSVYFGKDDPRTPEEETK